VARRIQGGGAKGFRTESDGEKGRKSGKKRGSAPRLIRGEDDTIFLMAGGRARLNSRGGGGENRGGERQGHGTSKGEGKQESEKKV